MSVKSRNLTQQLTESLSGHMRSNKAWQSTALPPTHLYCRLQTCGERGRTSASGHAACPHFRWATDDTVQRAKRSAAKCRSHETSPRFHCVTSQSLAAVLKTLRGRARPRVSYAPSSAHSPIPHRRHAAVLHLSKTPHFFAMGPGSHNVHLF